MSDQSPSGAAGRLASPALAVTRHLLVHGPASRGHLGQDLNLSDASMSRVARRLVRDGLVSEDTDPGPASIGRPRRILSPVPTARHVVGVKLTTDTAYGVVCDLLGSIAKSGTARLPAAAGSMTPVRPTIDVVARLVRRLTQELPTLDGVGVSVGGLVTRREVRDGIFLGWRGVPLAELLEARVRVPVVVTNDVTALAREQLWFGAGRTHPTFGLITVGAGLGFGVVRDGNVVEQLIDNGHLLGHAPIDAGTGPRCGLGHRGCVASYLYPGDVQRRLAGAGAPAAAAPADAASVLADPRVRADAARALAHLAATVAGALQTDRIVLAGEGVGMLYADPVFRRTLNERLTDETGGTRLSLDVSVEPSTFTDWARGAAVVGIQLILGAL